MNRYYNKEITRRRGGEPSAIQIYDIGVLDSIVVKHNEKIINQKELIYVKYSLGQHSYVTLCSVSIFGNDVINIFPMENTVVISNDNTSILSSYSECNKYFSKCLSPQRKELINVLTHYYKILLDESTSNI